MSENRLTPNRQYKDRLFRFIFQDKRDLLSLYNAVNGSSYENPDELEIHTLDDVMYMSMKNDVSFLIDNRLSLYEEQSNWNPNMPLRGLFYFSRLYAGYVADRRLNLYSDSKVQFPFPQFVVFYIGQERQFERKILRLSDSFEPVGNQIPSIECTAEVINIRAGHNESMIKACRKLYEYSFLVCTVQDFVVQGYSLLQSISRAIEICIGQGILIDFLRRYRAEVTDMILSEYDEELHLKSVEESGERRGMKKGEWRINLLNTKLIEQNRFDDLKRSVSDLEFQKQLIEELRINEVKCPFDDPEYED